MRAVPRGRLHAALALAPALAGLLVGCSVHMEVLSDDPGETAFLTRRPWSSMVYLAETDSGVIAIDLGWRGNRDAFDEGLRRLGRTVDDVTHVFVTHTHRDHIAGWQVVSEATFHMHEWAEPGFLRERPPADFPSSLSEALNSPSTPERGQVQIRPFGRDTAFVLGADTVYAYSVAGHTAGSAAYRFRDVLFVGDAVSYMPVLGFHGPSRLYSENRQEGTANLAALFEKIEGTSVRWVCTSHGKCAQLTPEFRRRTTGRDGSGGA